MVLAVLVFVKCHGVCAVLVLVDAEFALLAKLEEAVAGASLQAQVFPDQAGQKRSLRKGSQYLINYM